MWKVLGEEMPEEDAVRAYLKDPDKPAALSTANRGDGQAAGARGGELSNALRPDPIPAVKRSWGVNSVEEFLSIVCPDDFCYM